VRILPIEKLELDIPEMHTKDIGSLQAGNLFGEYPICQTTSLDGPSKL
jgi:hypothetical protein